MSREAARRGGRSRPGRASRLPPALLASACLHASGYALWSAVRSEAGPTDGAATFRIELVTGVPAPLPADGLASPSPELPREVPGASAAPVPNAEASPALIDDAAYRREIERAVLHAIG